jgi:hypothetical protein
MKRSLLLSAIAAVTLGIASTASAIYVDYTLVADGDYATLNYGGTTVTGSAAVESATYAGFRGLGVVGGGANYSLDTGETMSINLNQLSSNVRLTLVDINPPGNVTFSFEAFNGLASLGTFSFPAAIMAPETYDLTTLAGGLDMSRFTVAVGSPSAPLGLQIQGVSFDSSGTVPDAGSTLTLLSLGCATLGMLRLRRS